MTYVLAIQHRVQHLAQWFGAVAHEPYAMLLDSASPQHPNSRYDILVCRPAFTLQSHSSLCQLHDTATGQLITRQGNAFSWLPELTEQRLPRWPADAPALPFTGGWLGYFSYDAGRVLEVLPNAAQADITLPDIALGAYLHALVLDKTNGELSYIDATGNAQQSWPMLAKALALVCQDGYWLQDIKASSSDLSVADYQVGPWHSNMTKAQYLDKFKRVQQYLQSGDCYQINLAQRFSADFSGDAWAAYLILREANQAPFSAFIQLPHGAVLSISPERFIEVKDRRIETKPIKGTRPRFVDPAVDKASAEQLAASPKDRAENVMIVDLLRNDLGKVSQPGTVKVPALFAIESFPAVHHLVSTITGDLAEGLSAFDALAAAFPGGSITGAPKVRAMQIIEELEPHRRSVYCGAVGYVSLNGHMDTNIAIRTLVIDRQAQPAQIHCWAGGGIVADSIGGDEYQETFDKVSRIVPQLSQMPRHTDTQNEASP